MNSQVKIKKLPWVAMNESNQFFAAETPFGRYFHGFIDGRIMYRLPNENFGTIVDSVEEAREKCEEDFISRTKAVLELVEIS